MYYPNKGIQIKTIITYSLSGLHVLFVRSVHAKDARMHQSLKVHRICRHDFSEQYVIKCCMLYHIPSKSYEYMYFLCSLKVCAHDFLVGWQFNCKKLHAKKDRFAMRINIQYTVHLTRHFIPLMCLMQGFLDIHLCLKPSQQRQAFFPCSAFQKQPSRETKITHNT